MINLEVFFFILYVIHQTPFSVYGYLLVPLLFVEDYPFSTHFLCASSKISYHIHVVYFWTLYFNPMINLPILVPIWYCFHYYIFIISSKSGSATPPTWLFCFKVAWPIWDICIFVWTSQSNDHFYRNCSGSPPCFSVFPFPVPHLDSGQ